MFNIKKTDKLKNTNWKLSEAEQKIKQLRNNSMIKWFLAGAAVMSLLVAGIPLAAGLKKVGDWSSTR